MLESVGMTPVLAQVPAWIGNLGIFLQVLIGFSIIIFVHELGHFLAAKWVGVRVDRFAVGFGYRLFGYRRGEGFTFGNRPEYGAEELRQRNYGETDYCFKALPFGGYVKMLGQDDIIIDEQTGEMQMTDDPRAFTNRPVGQRMVVVSAGVIFNLIFAAIALMAGFMIGRQVEPPVIGLVDYESAAYGKLLPGDRIVAADGKQLHEFKDLQIAAVFADGPMHLTVERNGDVLPKPVEVTPQRNERVGLTMLDVMPFLSARLTMPLAPVDGLPNVRPGDRIVTVAGQPVESGLDVFEKFRSSGGKVLELGVERAVPGESSEVETVKAYQRADLRISPSGVNGDISHAHILGMLRRRKVYYVAPNSPAADAGFEVGDVIADWGTISNPLYDEIVDHIQEHANEPIRVVVLRGDEEVALTVTPRRSFQLFRKTPVRVGVSFASGEENRAVVADVVEGSPATGLAMPRGARLVAVGGEPVVAWRDVVNRLFDLAGQTVGIEYEYGGERSSGQLRVPSSVVNELNLPATAVIKSIAGQDEIELPPAGGSDKPRLLQLPSPEAVRELLARHVGETVDVVYLTSPIDGTEQRHANFAVQADNLDPWQMRIQYAFDLSQFRPLREELSAGGNPWVALQMGLNTVGNKISEVYLFLRGLATRDVSVEHVAGPVGIFAVAFEEAKSSWTDLVFLMAFLSINLAVINFLPLPVMDGGLMVFLLIEKIKGKPLSLKAQMISTLVGLAAILLIALLVTIQDISRLFGGSFG